MSVDGLTVSRSMRPSPLWTWVALGALASLLVASSLYIVDRANVTPTELGERLFTEPFERNVPPGVHLGGRGLDTRPHAGGAAAVSLRFEEDEPIQGFGGSPAVIQYWVLHSPGGAERRFHEYWQEVRGAKRVHGYKQEITRLGNAPYPAFCLHSLGGGEAYCQAVIENVWMEALSRIDQLHLADRSYVMPLFDSGVKHLQSVL